MNLLALVFLAGGLSVDSWLVSLAHGIAEQRPRARHAAALAITLGVFQGGMLWIGWLIGEPSAHWLGDFDHWIAFGLLSALGVKFIRDGSSSRAVARPSAGWTALAFAGVATSVDALAAGFALALGDASIALAVALTASLTACGSLLAYYGGRHVGQRWSRGAHWLAGAVLIAIGLLILYEHSATTPA